jgi:hypothetical protein
VVADRQVGDPRSDGLHAAGGLVAEHGGNGEAALLHGHVAVADPTVGDPDEDFPGSGLLDLEVVDDFEWGIRSGEQGGAHDGRS